MLIGPVESMPLPGFNRLHCMELHLSNDGLQGSTLPPSLPQSNKSGLTDDAPEKNTAGKLRCQQNEVMMVFCKRPRLLDFSKTPTHLQFNKYVLTGYRPVSTAQECLRSLFYMHNELGNIYTHGESRGHCMMVRFSLIRDRLSNR